MSHFHLKFLFCLFDYFLQIFDFGEIRVQMRIYARNVVKRDFLRDFQTLWDMHSVAIRRIFWHPLIDYCTIWNRDAILQILFDSCMLVIRIFSR